MLLFLNFSLAQTILIKDINTKIIALLEAIKNMLSNKKMAADKYVAFCFQVFALNCCARVMFYEFWALQGSETLPQDRSPDRPSTPHQPYYLKAQLGHLLTTPFLYSKLNCTS